MLRLRLVHRSQHVRSRMVIRFMSGCSFKVAPCSVPFIYNFFFCLWVFMRVCLRCGTRRGGVPCAVALVVQPSLTASPCCQRPRHQSTTTCPVSRKKAREEERRHSNKL